MKGRLAWRRWELEHCVPAGEHQKFQAGLNLLEKQLETQRQKEMQNAAEMATETGNKRIGT